MKVQPFQKWNLTSSPQACRWKRAGMETLAAEEATGLSNIHPVNQKESYSQLNFSREAGPRVLCSSRCLALANGPTLTLREVFNDVTLKLPGGRLDHLSSALTRLLTRFE